MTLFAWADANVDDYVGGMWETVQITDTLGYRRLRTDKDKLTIHNKGAFWSKEVSTDCMGIVATLCAINHALWSIAGSEECKTLTKLFYRLRDWALVNHPEATDISMALD